MISKIHRFHGYGSLNFLHAHSKVVRGAGLSIKYVANTHRTTYRAAVVVSKKVSKSAVVRNRIRRRVYEIVRQNVNDTSTYDFAVMIYDPAVATMAASSLESNVVGLLKRASIVT